MTSKTAPRKKKWPQPYSAKWEKLADQQARGYCPTIYPCQKCGFPVIKGYVCGSCGDSDPSSK